MSAVKTWNLICDHCGRSFNSQRPSVHETRADAALAGWSHVFVERTAGRQWGRTLDACPAHQEAPPAP